MQGRDHDIEEGGVRDLKVYLTLRNHLCSFTGVKGRLPIYYTISRDK